MAQNNLRILYNNLVDLSPLSTSTVSASSTASSSMVATNLASDYKGLVWRTAQSSTSVGQTKGILKVDFTVESIIGAVILAFSNLKVGATVRVTGYVGASPVITAGTTDVPAFTTTNSTLVFDSGTVDVNKPALLGQFVWGLEELGVSGAELRRNYSVVWLPVEARVPVDSIVIEITNADNIDRYIEVSRLIVGNYWSPTYNFPYGLGLGHKNTGSTERSEAGDLISVVGSQNPVLTFDLAYMDTMDKNEMVRLIQKRSTHSPIFVSLFPENAADPVKEQMYQIYGKLAQTPGVTHFTLDMYNSQVEVEGI